MAEQAQLFDQHPTKSERIASGAVPQRSDKALALRELYQHPERYSPGFRLWLSDNWTVWTAFCRLARAAQDRGRTRYSARGIFHVLRFHSDIAEAIPMLNGVRLPNSFKVNNKRSAAMARLFNNMDPANAGFFETRSPVQ